MKKAIICCLVGAVSAFGTYAQDLREHTIDRGETLESIAEAYGVSTQDIIDANPEIKDMFFSGMVIKIPASSGKTISETQTNHQSVRETDDNSTANDTSFADNSSSYNGDDAEGLYDMREKGSNGLRFMIGYDITSSKNIKDGSGDFVTYSSGLAMEYNFLYRHYFINGLYGEIGTGVVYKSSTINFITEGASQQKNKYETFAIPINLFAGYTFAFSKYFGLDLYTGPLARIGVSCTRKYEGKKYKSDTTSGIGWGVGASIKIADFDLGAQYIIPLGDNIKIKGLEKTKQNTLMVYLGWTMKF